MAARLTTAGFSGAIAVAGALALGFAISTPARGTNWAGATGRAGDSEIDSTACHTGINLNDNKDVNVYYTSSAPTILQQASTWVRNNVINPTTLDTTTASSHTEKTDIVVSSANYTILCEAVTGLEWYPYGDLIGLYQCEVLTPSGRCDHAIIRVYKDYVNYISDTRARRIMCHEFGHAFALKHRSAGDGCIQTPAEDAAPGTWYTPHDLNHLNAAW